MSEEIPRKTKVQLPGGQIVEATVDPDVVDLEAEDVRDSKGRRIDQAYVDRALAASLAARPVEEEEEEEE